MDRWVPADEVHKNDPMKFLKQIMIKHADTPGPALLGLPACKRLAVVQVNCAVMTTQPNRSLTGTAPTKEARVAKPPAGRTPKPKCIMSTDDLMREFPDRFTEIGKPQVNTRYDCIQMLIWSYMHPENA